MPDVSVRPGGELAVRLPRLVGGAELLVALRGGVQSFRRPCTGGALNRQLVLTRLEHLADLSGVLRKREGGDEEKREKDSFHILAC